ncbi:hypothetical protein [Paenibacillus alvei]|uniref:Septum formation initiator n=3 Tax=Paenibacillus alvei TaxID=44250 RepID=A0ABT4H160_PAEAL|nr:hypothetical protein [Paenibacillus alvei]EJW16433.1 hypothetical protein PAV_5c00120 [Paenibacillus alvei DSM 29]MCY9762713.1 hypothetical protein [Paenibacillus alvei]
MEVLEKRARRMFYLVIAGLTLSLTFNVWDGIEKNKLNQQYAQLIEQREKLNQKYEELNKQYEYQIKQGNHINEETEINTKRARDLLSSLTDLRNDLYFQKVKKNATQ